MKATLFKSALFAMAIALTTAACNKDEDEERAQAQRTVTLGKYLYLDRYNCLHIKRDCIAIFLSEKRLVGVRRFPTKDFNLTDIPFYCEQCVTDDMYETIQDTIASNRTMPALRQNTTSEQDYPARRIAPSTISLTL